MNKNMVVSVNPHIYASQTTQTIMRDVLIALFPAVIASIVFFGIQALLVEVVCGPLKRSPSVISPSPIAPPLSPGCCWP